MPVRKLAMNQRKLRWQCRRGMRELDVLLQRYLDLRYAHADDAEKAAFHAVLSLADPELASYLLQREVPASEAIAGVIDNILSLPPA